MARRIDLSMVQDAVGNLLASDATLTSILGNRAGRIQGATRSDVALPYVAIGESESLDTSVQGLEAKRVRMYLHVWTSERGFDQAKQIEGAIVAALDENEFDVAEHRIVSCFHEETRYFREQMDGLRHAVVEFDVDVEPLIFRGDLSGTVEVFVDASGSLGDYLVSTITVNLIASGTVLDAVVGDSTASLAAVGLTASGIVADGVTGSATSSIGEIGVSASGSITTGTAGSLSASIGEVTVTGSATIGSGLTGSLFESIGAIGVVSSGDVSSGITGDATPSIGAVTSDATGTVGSGISGNMTAAIGAVTTTSSGTVGDGLTGGGVNVLGQIGVTGSGVVSSGIVGTATPSIGEIGVTSSATVADGVTGDATGAIGEIGVTGSGTLGNGVTGDLSASIGEIGVTGSGDVSAGIIGTASMSIGAITSAASATVADGIAANTTASVGAITTTSAGTVSGGAPTADFKVLRGEGTIASGSTSVTLTAGVDFTLEAGVVDEDWFCRLTNSRSTGRGGVSGNQDSDDVMIAVSQNSTSITFTRQGTGGTVGFAWEILQYIGSDGGPNEFKVRSKYDETIATSSTSKTVALPGGVTNAADVIPIIAGQSVNIANRDNYQAGLHTAAISGSNVTLERGEDDAESQIGMVIVEFTGSNWTVTQEAMSGHGVQTLGTAVSAIANTMLIPTFTWTATSNAFTRSVTGTVELTSTTQISTANVAGDAAQTYVVWLLQNDDMTVERYSGTPSNANTTPTVTTVPITTVNLDETMFGAVTSGSDGQRAMPRGLNDFHFLDDSNVTLTQRNNNQATQSYAFEVVTLPQS